MSSERTPTGDEWIAPSASVVIIMDLTICIKMSGQDGKSRVRFLIRYTASDWPLPDVRFSERRSIVGLSLFTPPADVLQSEYSLAAFPLSFFQPSHRYHAGVERVPRPRQWPIRLAPVCSL